MPKQIKIGFDKVPSPVTKQYPQLVDIQGAKLYDAAGNPLLTEEEGFLQSFTQAENSLSVHVNNIGEKQSVPVEEQFPAESEVSLTLLGVPRSEEQLSLFSDVAVYGLDEENWNYYTYDAGWNYPGGWYYRTNPTYGMRGSPSFVEESKEQALYLKTYPVQYSFPFGPQWNENKEPTSTFKQFMNFIGIGKYLYQIFKESAPKFANDNLITENITIVDSTYTQIPVDGDWSGLFAANGDFSQLVNSGSFYDVDYGDDDNEAFNQIEKFTLFFRKIVNDVAAFPTPGSSQAIGYESTQEYRDLRSFCINNCRPGSSSTVERFGVLESKRSFRYQPGRVSGFTYGIRMNTDPSSLANFIEWGASNKTDEYMFQLRGSEFNIVRRSVIPMPLTLLERMGLEESDQKVVYPIGLDNENALYETVIPRTKFTGDSLDGNGPSGRILDFKTVTMFKIEFSWYGAIGAKFYAYVPSSNDGARWVLIHTLIIENGLEQPILKNPDFKFKYLLYSSDTANLLEPVYVYKYGSSYYIDGGDEGTIRLASNTTEAKPFTELTPIMGILPKNEIINSEGDAIDNNRKTYPSVVSVNSSADARIDVEEVTGSPDGIHYHYSPSLHKGIGDTSETVQLTLSADGGTLQFANTQTEFTESQYGSKVIASGIYNTYIGIDEESTTTAPVRRRSGYSLASGSIARETVKADGSVMTPRDGQVIEARLSKYTVAASTVGIYANEFKIHWLNPAATDNSGLSRADYFVGVSYEAPNLNVDGDLVFGVDENPYDLDSSLSVEWTNTGVLLDTKNRERRDLESGYGTRLQIDTRLPQPTGANSGRISAIHGKVAIIDYPIDPTIVDNGDGTFRINFATAGTPPVDSRDIGVAEVGVNRNTAFQSDGVTPIRYTQPIQYDSGSGTYYATVDGDISSGGSVTVTSIQAKTLTLTDDWKLNSFTQSGGERFSNRKFSISRTLRFNIQPLYPVIGLRDNAKVNNIIIEEITPQFISASTPAWITDDSAISVQTVAGESDVLAPSAFNSEDRLSSIRFDSSTLQPLRRPSDKSNVVYSFYVEGGKPERFELDKIFNQDRKGVTPGQLNNKAYFFSATGLGAGGNIEMTLTVKEQ
jgi:hypothetical protein